MIFGDGAGAVLLEPCAEGEVGLIDYTHEIDGSGAGSLYMPGGGSLHPSSAETVAAEDALRSPGRARGVQVRGAQDGRGDRDGAGKERRDRQGRGLLYSAPGEQADHPVDGGAAWTADGAGDDQYRPLREYDGGDDPAGDADGDGGGPGEEGRPGAAGQRGGGIHGGGDAVAVGDLKDRLQVAGYRLSVKATRGSGGWGAGAGGWLRRRSGGRARWPDAGGREGVVDVVGEVVADGRGWDGDARGPFGDELVDVGEAVVAGELKVCGELGCGDG